MFYNDKMKQHYNVVALNTIYTKRINGLHYICDGTLQCCEQIGESHDFCVDAMHRLLVLPTSVIHFSLCSGH